MSSFVSRVQFLDDTDPFNSTNFPEPTRPPLYTFREDIPLINQIAGVHRLLKAPHKVRTHREVQFFTEIEFSEVYVNLSLLQARITVLIVYVYTVHTHSLTHSHTHTHTHTHTRTYML
ncbi:hypothetical protein PO909_003878 [Leuciscus waleckii]